MPRLSGSFDRLVLKNVRCFQDAVIPLDDKVTVIIGENGAGKSTIIEALACLTYGGRKEGFEEFPLRRGTKQGEIALYEEHSQKPAALWYGGKAAVQKELPKEQYLFAYGRYRRVFIDQETPDARSRTPAERLDDLVSRVHERRTNTVIKPDNNLLRDISGYLTALNEGRKSDPRLQQVWKELNRVLGRIDPKLGAIKIVEDSSDTAPRLTRHGIDLELHQLSDGYQSLLVILFDLAVRYPYLFTSSTDPLNGRTLVAIDEIDLHLHPRWQRLVVAQLIDLFPNTQFVVTTHSAIVAQGAIDMKMTIVALQEEEEKGGVTPKTLGSKSLAGLKGSEVGSILLEDRLFGIGSRYSVEFSEIEEKVDLLQHRVNSGKATDQDLDDVSNYLSKLEELVAREDERRADGSTVAQMVRLESAFVKDLIAQLKKARQ